MALSSASMWLKISDSLVRFRLRKKRDGKEVKAARKKRESIPTRCGSHPHRLFMLFTLLEHVCCNVLEETSDKNQLASQERSSAESALSE